MRTSKGVAVCDRALLFYNPIVVAQVNASLRGGESVSLSENHYKDGVEGGVVCDVQKKNALIPILLLH